MTSMLDKSLEQSTAPTRAEPAKLISSRPSCADAVFWNESDSGQTRLAAELGNGAQTGQVQFQIGNWSEKSTQSVVYLVALIFG